MYRFNREKILPLMLSRRESLKDLAARAGVNVQTAKRALDGQAIRIEHVDKIARALEVEPLEYLVQVNGGN